MPNQKCFSRAHTKGASVWSVALIIGSSWILSGCQATPTKPGPPWTTSRIQGVPEPPPSYTVHEAFGGIGFTEPVFVIQIPGSDRFLVGELCGRIYSIRKSSPDHILAIPEFEEPALAIDLWPDLPNRPPPPTRNREEGQTDSPLPAEHVYDLAFHPDFSTNRQVFVTYSLTGSKPLVQLSRMHLSTDDPPVILRDNELQLMTWKGAGHNGGCVRFGPDGYLYVSTGDGVMPIPPDADKSGQDITNLLSSVLRIDVDRTEGDLPYAIPSDNPFLDLPQARGEVWAYGFRNPWKMDFNHQTGDLWLGDVGWETWEMIHRVQRGGNYGWSVMEGRMSLRDDVEPGPTPIIPPVKDHPRSEANSITGGVVYAGTKHKDLSGWFVYGDYRTGKVWALDADGVDHFQHRELAHTTVRIVAFTQDSDGEIYLLDHDLTGKIYRLVPAPQQEYNVDFPQQLSDTGLFKSVRDLEPAPGVIPYEVNVQPWMDGAFATRLVALPGRSQIQMLDHDARSEWEFPNGAVLVRNIFFRTDPQQKPLRLETQLLHRENNSWRAYTYQWNEAQDNAHLVTPAGSEQTLAVTEGESETGTREQSWRVLSRAECIFCHRRSVGTVLGFSPAQLDLDVPDGDSTKNQLTLLSDLGLFSGQPPTSVDDVSKLVDPHDELADLDDRGRSYLDVNCGICHNKRGETITMFHLKRHLTLQETKAMKPPAVASFGISDAHVVAPGDPNGSALIYRMATAGYGRMPYVGSEVVDSKGVTLIHHWMESLDPSREPLAESDAAAMETLMRDGTSDEATLGATTQLLGTTRGAIALAIQLHQGTLSKSARQRIVRQSQESPMPDIRGLFKTFIPLSERIQRLGPHARPEDILNVPGDAGRGKLIYMSDGSRCRTCHIPDKQGHTMGPKLDSIGKKYPKPELLRQILEPSLKIEPEYTSYVLVTEAGKVHTGIQVEKNDDEVVLKNVRNEVIRIPSDEIDTMDPQDRSIMPERLLSDMTAQEAADLLAYLSTLRQE